MVDYLCEIDMDDITHLYELRHACNVLGNDFVSKKLNIPKKRIINLCNSDVHGSESLEIFLNISWDDFLENIELFELENYERLEAIYEAKEKNRDLMSDLKKSRESFAGIGTNKVKRRLNKLSINNSIAKAVRIVLEIEDKNISAKKCHGQYRDRIYNVKSKLILDLCQLFEEKGWKYGIQESEIISTSHVIYFEIPGCEQISWHFTPENENMPEYEKDWDGKPNSTLGKLEALTVKILNDNDML